MPLSKAAEDKAKKELNENPNKRSKDVQALRDMVQANPALKCPTDDEFLLRFLRARKFNYDRAYNMVIEYYTIRAENKSVFDGALPSKLQTIFDHKVTLLLPNRDKNGCRIFYFRPAKWDYSVFPMMEIMKVNMLLLENAIKDEDTQVHGMVVVGDFTDMSMGHVKHFDRDYARLMTSMVQDAFPMRLKALHLCNQPGIFNMVWTIVKTFIKEKMAKRIHFHGSDLSKLQKEIGKENLPVELGGALGPADLLAEACYDELKKYEACFAEALQYKIELSRAISHKKTDDVVDSLMGTYKKLNVD